MTPDVAAALRAGARGTYSAEAGIELIIHHDCFLHRRDFSDRFVHTSTSITDGSDLAEINWTATINALNNEDLHCSSSEQQMLRIAASLADGTPVNLRNALTGLDARNIKLVITAVLHTSGQHPSPETP